MKENYVQKIRQFQRLIAWLWCALVCTLMTFYVDNSYFNIVEAKTYMVKVSAIMILAIFTSSEILTFYQLSFKEMAVRFLKSLNLMDISIIAFAVTALISVASGVNALAAFSGNSGWGMGAEIILLLTGIYFFVSRNLKIDDSLIWLLTIPAAVVMGISLLNGCHIDPFSLHAFLAEDDYSRYVATIGNINWFVGYLSMLVPPVMYLSLREKRVGYRIWYGFFTLLGGINIYVCNSDGIFLGFGASFILIICFVLKRRSDVIHFFEQIILLGVASAITALLSAIVPDFVTITGILAKFIKSGAWLMAFAVSLLCIFLLWKMKDEVYQKYSKWLRILFVTAVIVTAVLVLIHVLRVFNDDWGHRRGYIWSCAITIYGNLPLVQKLFGCGADCFGIMYEALKDSSWIRNAHNEYLQYLVTTGVFGLVTYCSVYLSALRSHIDRKPEENVPADAILIGIAGYAGQALVNNPQALNMVIFYLLLSCYRNLGLDKTV